MPINLLVPDRYISALVGALDEDMVPDISDIPIFLIILFKRMRFKLKYAIRTTRHAAIRIEQLIF